MDFGVIDPGLVRALLGDAPRAEALPAPSLAGPDPRRAAALVCALGGLAILVAALPWG